MLPFNKNKVNHCHCGYIWSRPIQRGEEAEMNNVGSNEVKRIIYSNTALQFSCLTFSPLPAVCLRSATSFQLQEEKWVGLLSMLLPHVVLFVRTFEYLKTVNKNEELSSCMRGQVVSNSWRQLHPSIFSESDAIHDWCGRNSNKVLFEKKIKFENLKKCFAKLLCP